jgi:hypothetical protein
MLVARTPLPRRDGLGFHLREALRRLLQLLSLLSEIQRRFAERIGRDRSAASVLVLGVAMISGARIKEVLGHAAKKLSNSSSFLWP